MPLFSVYIALLEEVKKYRHGLSLINAKILVWIIEAELRLYGFHSIFIRSIIYITEYYTKENCAN